MRDSSPEKVKRFFCCVLFVALSSAEGPKAPATLEDCDFFIVAFCGDLERLAGWQGGAGQRSCEEASWEKPAWGLITYS